MDRFARAEVAQLKKLRANFDRCADRLRQQQHRNQTVDEAVVRERDNLILQATTLLGRIAELRSAGAEAERREAAEHFAQMRFHMRKAESFCRRFDKDRRA